MITSLKQSKTKFELSETLNHNFGNKKYNVDYIFIVLNAKMPKKLMW